MSCRSSRSTSTESKGKFRKFAMLSKDMHLEAKGRKFAAVSDAIAGLHIQVKYMQKSELAKKDKVTVYKETGKENFVNMAFCFKHETKSYFAVVERNDVQLQMIPDVEMVFSDTRCLFQWEKKSGKWGNLKSVAEPQKYLWIQNNKVTVSTKDHGLFRFRDLEDGVNAIHVMK